MHCFLDTFWKLKFSQKQMTQTGTENFNSSVICVKRHFVRYLFICNKFIYHRLSVCPVCVTTFFFLAQLKQLSLDFHHIWQEPSLRQCLRSYHFWAHLVKQDGRHAYFSNSFFPFTFYCRLATSQQSSCSCLLNQCTFTTYFLRKEDQIN